jgi:hypothetical protein
VILENNHGSCVLVVNYLSQCIIVEKVANVIYVTLCSISFLQIRVIVEWRFCVTGNGGKKQIKLTENRVKL